MSIFKRKKAEAPQSGPKVFTPEDYSKLMTEQQSPQAMADPGPQATPAPPAEEPATPSFDSISPQAITEGGASPAAQMPAPEQQEAAPSSAPGPSLTEEHPEKILPISVHHTAESPDLLGDALSEEVAVTAPKPRRTSPFEEDGSSVAPAATSPTPGDAPEANVAEPPAMPLMDTSEAAPQEDEFKGNPVPPLDQPAPEETQAPPIVESAQTETPTPQDLASGPEAAPLSAPAPPPPSTAEPAAAAQQMDPAEVQDLAKRVSQALVDLEELRQQKEQLEQSLQELQAKHAELEAKIEQQRKIATELLEQVHRAV